MRSREPLTTDVIGIAVGILMIAFAVSRLGNQIQYAPGDPRAQAGVNLAITIIGVTAGVFVLSVAVVRLLMGLRARRP